MEGGVARSLLDRGYLAGLAGVLTLEAAGVAAQAVTGIPVPGATVVAAAFVVACMFRIHGLRGTLAFVALVFAIPYASEFLGVLTGVPFGAYAYTGLTPWLFGLVPFFIFIAWIHIGYLVIATTTLGLGRSSLWLAPLDGVLAVAWDAMVDPLAVRAGFWRWTAPGGFYGVPLSNFLGWFLVVTLLSVVARFAWSRDATQPVHVSRSLQATLPALLLGTTAAFAALAALSAMPIAAAVGLAVIVPAVLASWSRIRTSVVAPAPPNPWSPRAAVARGRAVDERAGP